jgi:hypothetical protein
MIPLVTNIELYDLTPRPASNVASRVLIENHYIVSSTQTGGNQYSPFNIEEIRTTLRYEINSCRRESADYVIYDINTGKFLRFSDVVIHLIELILRLRFKYLIFNLE